VRPKASWAGLICRTDQCFQRQRLPYACWITQMKSNQIKSNVYLLKWEKQENWLQLSPLTTSIILSSNKIQNGDVLVPAIRVHVQKMSVKRTERVLTRSVTAGIIVPTPHSGGSAIPGVRVRVRVRVNPSGPPEWRTGIGIIVCKPTQRQSWQYHTRSTLHSFLCSFH